MKKVFSTLLVAGMFAFVACGPSAEEKAATEKAKNDSIAAVAAKASQDSMDAANAAAKAAMEAADKAKADSMAAVEAAAAAKKPAGKKKGK